jgi:hypothetical protein
MTLSTILWLLALVGVLVVGTLARDTLKTLSGSGLVFLAGLFALFIGERVFGDSALRSIISGLGLLTIALSVGLRIFALRQSQGERALAHQYALIGVGIGGLGLFLYALTLPTITGGLGLDAEATARWSGSLSGLWPIGVCVGTTAALLVDRSLALHPVRLPVGAAKRSFFAATSLALGLCLVFPINYLASAHKIEKDVAYFRTTRPGDSTLALINSLGEPINAHLFFAPGSDVNEQVRPYFETLAAASGGRLTVEHNDQPLNPVLAKELKIRENGYIALTRGENVEKFKVGTNLKKARRELKKLDATVQKHLLKLTREQRTVYFLVGHGEASAREKDNLLRKLNLFKKLLQAQNYQVKNLGAAEGSTDTVPEDAAMVIIAAPEEALLPEEERSLSEYIDQGGSLMVFVDPGGDPLEGLLTKLGLTAGSAPVAHHQAFIRQTRGKGDRVLLVTNRFGSHDSVSTLSRNSTQLALIMPTTLALEKLKGAAGKLTTIIRSFPDSWVDTNGNRERDDDEPAKVLNLGFAVEGGDGDNEYRALVIGDINLLGDPILQFSRANQTFVLDAVRWLAGDEEISGSINSEEDVKIRHTRDENWAAFYLTVVAFPLLVLVAGGILIRLRRTTP